MQELLKDLYYGKIHPLSEPLEDLDGYKKMADIISRNEKNLISTLSDSQGKLYQKQGELNVFSSEQKFIQGFKLGAKLVIEIMNDDKITE